MEFEVDDDFIKNNEAGKALDIALLDGVKSVEVT